MENYYFTFGSWERFPYHNTYLVVKASDRNDAVLTYRHKYPDVNEGVVCCSYIYSEEEWKRVGEHYEDMKPAEILVSAAYIAKKMSGNKKDCTINQIRKIFDEWEYTVAKIGSECIYTDKLLDKLPVLVEKLLSVKSERMVTLSDGTGMGDSKYVFLTDAPEEELQILEKVSCDIYKSGGSYEDVPIWQSILNDRGYRFECVDEHLHVSAFSTSEEWLENIYPIIEEHYIIDNQPELTEQELRLIAIFVVAEKTYEIYGSYEICANKDYHLKEYSYPEFSDLTAEIIEGNKKSNFVPGGVKWSGDKYDVEDMITDLLFKNIVGNKEYQILYLDEALKQLVETYRMEKISLEEMELPFRMLGKDLYEIFELTLVTDKFIYYGCGEDMLMFDIDGLDIISDNYFAGAGFYDSCENIKNGKEKLLWSYESFEKDYLV